MKKNDFKRPSRVSVIIPSYLPGEELRRCVESVLASCSHSHFELCVVDSSPRDPSGLLGGLLSDRRVSLLRSEERLMPGAARDLGARHADGEVLAFIDSDCTAGPGWLDRLVEGLGSSGCTVCCGGVENGTPGSYFGTAEFLCMVSAFTPRAGRKRARFAISGNMAIRREAYFNAGGFNSAMRTGEDVELGFRLHRAGEKIAFLPEAYVFHHNRRKPLEFMRNQYRLGRGAAVNFLGGRLRRDVMHDTVAGRMAMALAAGPVRFLRIVTRSIRQGELPLPRLLTMLPAILAGSISFWAGFAGAVFGAARWSGKADMAQQN